MDGAGAAAYADSLTRVAEMKCGMTRRLLVNTFAAAESSFSRRIRRILNTRPTRMTLRLSITAGIIFAFIACFGLPTVSSAPEQPPSFRIEVASPPSIYISPDNKEMQEKLEKMVSVNFVDTHISAALDYLNQSYGLNAAVDWRVIAPEKRRQDSWYRHSRHDHGRISQLQAPDTSMQSVLLVLASLATGNAALEVGPSVVWITSKTMSDSESHRRRASTEAASPGLLAALARPVNLSWNDMHLDQIP